MAGKKTSEEVTLRIKENSFVDRCIANKMVITKQGAQVPASDAQKILKDNDCLERVYESNSQERRIESQNETEEVADIATEEV